MNVSSGFPYYISLTENIDLKNLFSSKNTINLLSGISEEQSKHRYEKGKWSIKQIIGHITDHERIMVYRSLRISRKDLTPLPSYDQDSYVLNANFDQVLFSELLIDFITVRKATLSFLNLLTTEQLSLRGLVWKFEISVEDALRTTIGHEFHHVSILNERYL